MTKAAIENERTVNTGNIVLDDDDDSWADAPLTEEEEEALRQGREDFKNGNYLTLEEFMKGL